MKKEIKRALLLVLANVAMWGMLFLYWYINFYNTTANISIDTSPIVLEYGNILVINKSKMVSEENTTFINNVLNKTYDDVRKSVFINRSELNYEEDGVTLKVGEHKLSVVSRTNEKKFYIKFNEKDVLTIPVTVADTTPPVFTKTIGSMSTYQGVPIQESLISNFEAKDLSDFTIYSIGEESIDYETVGEYTVSVIAEDVYGNQTKEELLIQVKAPTITLNKSSASLSVGETIQLSPEVNGKSQEVQYTSSNTSVATVSNTGVITAKSNGNCTITATANGVSASMNVTVKTKRTSFFRTDGSVSQSAIDAGVAQLELLPDHLYNYFKNNGWSYTIVAGTMHAGDYNVTSMSSGSVIYAATYWDGRDQVYVNQNHLTSSLLHELGHVVDCELGCESCSQEFGEIYQAEKGAYLNISGANNYAISSYLEYFADAFESYIKYSTKLERYCPRTYEYIKRVVNGL